MSVKTETVAVTGAGGFIGSHLVEELLRDGYRVRAMVRYNSRAHRGYLEGVEAAPGMLEIVSGDVCDARFVRETVRGCSMVFHLAALIGIPYSYTAPQSYVQTNVVGTLNVLEACREEGVRLLLHTSTSEVYGTALHTPMGEDHPLQAQSPYSASKIAADKLVESYVRSFELPAVTVRPFNTYGPRQSMRAVLPTILAQALSPDCAEVRLGSLNPVRDLTFVRDTAAGFVAVAAAPRETVVGKVYNLGTGSGISIGDLAQRVLATLGMDKPIVADDARVRPGGSEVLELISNNALVRSETGWQPKTTLEAGIELTARWVTENLAQLKPGVYTK